MIIQKDSGSGFYRLVLMTVYGACIISPHSASLNETFLRVHKVCKEFFFTKFEQDVARLADCEDPSIFV